MTMLENVETRARQLNTLEGLRLAGATTYETAIPAWPWNGYVLHSCLRAGWVKRYEEDNVPLVYLTEAGVTESRKDR